MGAHVAKDNEDFNQYRNDIDKIKNLVMIRSTNPMYWNSVSF